MGKKPRKKRIKTKPMDTVKETPHPDTLRRPPRLKGKVQRERIAKRHKKPMGYHRGHGHRG